MKTEPRSLCKDCIHRFRRVFIPLDPSEYMSVETNETLTDEENIIILNYCLVLDMSIDTECTIECNKFKPKENDNEVTLLRHSIK